MFRRAGLLLLDPLQVHHFDFSLNLTRQLSDYSPSSNLCFSPASVTLALALCYFGTAGPTKHEMARKIFGSGGSDANEDEKIKKWAENLMKQQHESSSNDENFRLKFANRIYLNENFDLKEKYVEFLKSIFQSDAALRANFASDGRAVAERINFWVENVTNHLIKNLISAESINAQTSMLLFNALYFKGVWEDTFFDGATKKEDFHPTANGIVKVDMMHKTDRQDYYEDNKIQAVSLAYHQSPVRAVFILPKKRNDLKNVVDSLNGRKLLNLLKSMDHGTKVEIAIPKIKMEQSFVLNDALKQMGLSSPFSNGADFSVMTNGSVKISDVIHKSFINLDEKGTEAAAVTVVRMVAASALIEKIPIEPKKFIADHPFLFLIINKHDHILFSGQFYGVTDFKQGHAGAYERQGTLSDDSASGYVEPMAQDRGVVQLFMEVEPDNVTLGNNVTFRCVVEGDDQATVRWHKGDGELPVRSEIDGNSLTILGVREEDAGIYRCEADTIAGRMTTDAVLQIDVTKF